MWLSVPTASELGSPPQAGESYNPLLWGIAICSQWEAPGLGPGTRRLQEAQASSPASYPLCCLEARRPGPEVIIKMENVVWPKDGASLMCLFAASARCTPPPFLEEAEKAERAVCGEDKKRFPSPKTQAREEKGIEIVLHQPWCLLSDQAEPPPRVWD